jgi:signal transduction histidine kinase
MLSKFLVANRSAVLALAKSKTVDISEDRPITEKSERGLPQFYDYLIGELDREARGESKGSEKKSGPSSTEQHGQELSRLGYTVSQVVHGYGTLCQAITELAEKKHEIISAVEFSALNLSLDVAIADAVTAFTKHASLESIDSAQRMGFLVHELRNALSAALIAQGMIAKGIVGTGGSTNALLERNLRRMRDILDRSFTEVRMHSEKAPLREPVRLIKVVEEVEATAREEARLRGLSIKVEVPGDLAADGDRNYLISAVANLVQNAIKYSKPGGTICVRGRDTADAVVLEVEDSCGGLPKGKAEALFQPFTQKGKDRSGLGLGLTISRQAVELNGGKLSVRDLPGKGCVFAIELPKKAAVAAATTTHRRNA